MNRIEQEYWKVITGGPLPHINVEKSTLFERLISEDKHKEVNIGQKALGYLKSSLKEDIPILLDNEKLKEKILDFWPYYNDFCIMCMQNRVWMLETDFSNMNKAERTIKKIDPAFNLHLNDGNGLVGGTAINLANDQYIILVDKKSYQNEEIILHEFTHYIQIASNKLVSDKSEGLSQKIKDFFNLNDPFIDYVLNRHEFYANIYNNLFNGLQKIYWTYFNKSYSWEGYIEEQMKELKGNVYEYRDSILTKIWKTEVGKVLSYLDVLACISYVDEQFFDDIVEKLKNK